MLADVLSSRGLAFAPKKVKIKNSTGGAVTKGDVLQFDILKVSGNTTNFKEGDEASAWFNCTTPVAAVVGHAFYCVPCEDMIADEIGEAWVKHPYLQINSDSAGEVRAGSGFSAVVTRALRFATAIVGAKAIAIPLELTNLGLTRCMFNGIEGNGIQQA